ncbi:MAG: SMI1/KNR4 family protein [Flavobacteriales bacterium]|nr:SMI1/KNR4 family protein [Flavobacteriales bacterium]
MIYSRYRQIAFETASPPPSVEELTAISSEIRAELPLSFVDFIRVANGAQINDYVIEVEMHDGSTEEMSFCSFFSSAASSKPGCFLGEIRMARENQGLPFGVLPFARDGGGSMAFLDLSATGAGRVVAYIHGLPLWAGLRTDSQFVELAASFDEYLSRLRLDIDGVLDSLAFDTSAIDHVLATEELLDIGLPLWRSNGLLVSAVFEARRKIGEPPN